MSSTNEALQIPEILFSIGSYLSKRSLLSSSTVCKAWHHSLQRLLWRRFVTGWNVDIFEIGPFKALARNGMHIQELILGNIQEATLDFALHCTRLNTLSLQFNESNLPNDILFSIVLGLVQSNQATLCNFESRYSFGKNQELYQEILRCPNLERLWLNGEVFSETTSKIFWDIFPQLKRLCLDGGSLSMSFTEDDVFPNLTHLRLASVGYEEASVMVLASHCPNLETLVSAHDDCSDFWDAYMNFLAKCPKLLSFSILDIDIESETRERFLKTLPPLKRVGLHEEAIRYYSDGDMYFLALQRHFGTLETVNLLECVWVTSRNIQQILCLCPRLRDIRADQLSAIDIEKGEPWICRNLEEFSVMLVDVGKTEFIDQYAIYDRLSKLKRLRILNLYPSSVNHLQGFHAQLKLKLGFGLERLEPLQRLKELRTGPRPLDLDAKDVEWMAHMWQGLEMIEAQLHVNPTIHIELETAFFLHGIQLKLPELPRVARPDTIVFDQLDKY